MFGLRSPNWMDIPGRNLLLVALIPQAIVARAARSQRRLLGQVYGAVGPGLIFTQHVFRRDKYVADDQNAAGKRFIATWAAKRNAVLEGDRCTPTLSYVDAPSETVFAVYIFLNETLTYFHDMYGWADPWAWSAADAKLAGAPVEWDTRYDKKLWSSEGR